MAQSKFERLMLDPNRTQREKLELLSTHWAPTLERMDDDELLACLRSIRKTINSRKLIAQRDALIGRLRRDGLAGAAALAKLAAPPPAVIAGPESAAEVAAEASRHRELEAEIAKDPRGREAYLVYRDWLESRGLVTDGRVSLGPLAECEDMLDELGWGLGFIRRCRVRNTLERFNGRRPDVGVEQVLAWLLDDPGPARFVRCLAVGLVRHDDNHYGGVCEVLGRAPRPALEELFLGDFGYEECELNWSTIEVPERMWAALPRLQSLTLRAGSMQLDGLDLPQLRTLETVTGGMPAAALRAITHARWPALVRLSLQIGAAHQGAATDVSLIDPLLAGTELPALVELGLCNCEFTDEICERLASAAILPRLRSLDLSMGTMTMAGVEALLRAPSGTFAQLERLDVDDNYLPPEAEALLGGLGPEIVFGQQRDGDGPYYASAYE
jgi:hypothetical protein